MQNKHRYARATGSLKAITKFLIKDLELAVKMIKGYEGSDINSFEVLSFRASIDQGKRVLAEVERDLTPAAPPDYNMDRTLSTGEIKDGNTGEIREAPVHNSDLPKDLPTSNKGF